MPRNTTWLGARPFTQNQLGVMKKISRIALIINLNLAWLARILR